MSLKHAITDFAHTAAQSPKLALSVSGGTVATGSATWLSWIPQDIGFYASSVGIVLSLVFIYNNIRGGIIKRQLDRAEYEKTVMEKEILRRELESTKAKNG